MITLHDSSNTDLSHLQAIADIDEGFALFDYVRVSQKDGRGWVCQIVQPNQNISIISDRLSPTVLHGLKLMQTNTQVKSVESVQIFDMLILGQQEGKGQMLTSRIRPLPGSVVAKLTEEEVRQVIEIPSLEVHEDESMNVIGELLNADNVPLCVTPRMFNHHILVAGGTGAGKSNAAANLVKQALKYKKCVLIHDAKPDYGRIHEDNTDPRVEKIWDRFRRYGLSSLGADKVVRIGFYKACDPASVNEVVGFRASDFNPDMLASLFFTGSSSEQLQYEAFATVAYALQSDVRDKSNQRTSYTVEDILKMVETRSDPSYAQMNKREYIHESVAGAILRKVRSRVLGMPWLDSVGANVGTQPHVGRLQMSSVHANSVNYRQVTAFNLEKYVREGQLIVIDYQRMDEQSYALILSYFLRVCHNYRRRNQVGIVQLVDEAHRIFDNASRHSSSLERAFNKVMREGRTRDHSIIISLQNATQIPHGVMNNLNSQIVMRQNSKEEADAATATMGKEYSMQSRMLGTGHALVKMFEARAIVLAQMAPSPYELMRSDNSANASSTSAGFEDEYDF